MHCQFLIPVLFAGTLLFFTACDTNQPATAAAEDTPTEMEAGSDAPVQPVASAEADYSDGLQLGEKAPAFELKNVDGKMYRMEDIRSADGSPARGYVITFTCNTCPYAQNYEQRLIDLHNELAPRGYPVIAIQPNDPELKPGDSFEAMKAQAEKMDYPFVYLLDEGQEIYPQYGASRTPEIYLLDADGVLRYHGAIDDNVESADAVTVNYVTSAVDAIENGRTPDPADVKAIGCTIKTKRS